MTRTHVGLTALLGLMIGPAISLAAIGAPSRIPNVVVCPKMTIEKCTDESWRACALKNKSTCKSLIESAWKAHHIKAKPKPRKMLKTTGDDIPGDVRTGHFYGYKPRHRTKQFNGSNLTVLDGVHRSQPTSTQEIAQVAHRNPKWEKNGALAATCEEYAYEMNYDWARFIDSTAACAGNDICVYNTSYLKNAPGIAYRELKRKDGASLGKVRHGWPSAKNVMFVNPSWAHAFGKTPLQDNDFLQRMKNDMQTGQAYRAVGCPSGNCGWATEKFAHEWDFHASMRKQTAGLSLEELEELDRRRAEFTELYSKWSMAAAAEVNKIKKQNNGWIFNTNPVKGKLQNGPMPWDLGLDPWTRQQVIHDFDNQAMSKTVQGQLNRGRLPMLKIPTGRLFVAPPLPQWGYGYSMPGFPPKPPSNWKPAPGMRKPNPLLADAKYGLHCDKVNTSGTALGLSDIHSCRVGEFLRREYLRKENGQLSCLDPKHNQCDWSPSMFHGAVLGYARDPLNNQQQLRDNCEAITITGSLTGTKAPNGLPISKVRSHLNQLRASINKAAAELAPYTIKNNNQPPRFGTTLSDGKSWGDSDLFTSGYNMHYGWSVGPSNFNGQQACQLDGDLQSGLTASGSILGLDFKILEAQATAKANKGNNRKLALNSYVRLLGHQLYSFSHLSVTQVIKSDTRSRSTPKATFTFAAGPVPVTVSGWGQLTGAYHIRGEGSFAQGCDVKNPTFGFITEFAPQVGAYANAQIGIGIGDLVSVGVRGSISLLEVTLPLNSHLQTTYKDLGRTGSAPHLKFDSNLALTLGSLAGRVALYFEFLFYEEEWELFRWNGLSHRIELVKLFDVEMPFLGLAKPK